MSTDIVHSRSSTEGKTATATLDDSVALDQDRKSEKRESNELAVTPTVDSVVDNDGHDGNRNRDEEKGNLSRAPAPADSEILTGKRLVVVWSAFLL